MPKRGKKYREAVAKYDKTALFEAPEALKLAVEASHAKFDETVEVHIKLGVDGRHADQQGQRRDRSSARNRQDQKGFSIR